MKSSEKILLCTILKSVICRFTSKSKSTYCFQNGKSKSIHKVDFRLRKKNKKKQIQFPQLGLSCNISEAWCRVIYALLFLVCDLLQCPVLWLFVSICLSLLHCGLDCWLHTLQWMYNIYCYCLWNNTLYFYFTIQICLVSLTFTLQPNQAVYILFIHCTCIVLYTVCMVIVSEKLYLNFIAG